MKKESFGEFLDSKSINVSKLAKNIGLTFNTVHCHSKGKQKISTDSAIKYSKYFDIDFNEFLERFVN